MWPDVRYVASYLPTDGTVQLGAIGFQADVLKWMVSTGGRHLYPGPCDRAQTQ